MMDINITMETANSVTSSWITSSLTSDYNIIYI